MRTRTFVLVGAAAFALVACSDLQGPEARTPPPPPSVSFEPPLIGGCLAPVTHAKVVLGDAAADESDVFLIRGSASTRDLRDVANDQPARALRQRIVPVTRWRDASGAVWLAPEIQLDLDQDYTLAVPKQMWSQRYAVVAHDDAVMLTRVWPPADGPGRATDAVWCEPGPMQGRVSEQPQPVRLAPDDTSGVMALGAFSGIGASCVRWRADGAPRGPLVPPVGMQLSDGRYARIDPTPLLDEPAEGVSEQPAECEAGWLSWGSVCVRVSDDRAVMTAAGAPVLVGVIAGEHRRAAVLSGGQALVLRPLPSDETVCVRLHYVDGLGEQHAGAYELKTLAVDQHVILNEVMANPVGPEPQQEWIELFNDGREEVDLAGWTIEDSGGQVPLAGRLGPGQYALVVNDEYSPDGWLDREPAPGTIMIRVPQLGKNGLSNSGEPLRLLGPQGQVHSQVPSMVSTKQGSSIARVHPDALDLEPGAFELRADGGTPGASNARETIAMVPRGVASE